ncbi:hypothetical protein HDV02_003564 [Globomyces sp. JEL0801]|nr:hypothetical protein HDV02_003564 [Globomyces sp. JEL0801]
MCKQNHMMRKNLKGLYVVHPSSWARVFFKTISFVISPKFAKKLFWLDTITELAPHVPFKDLYIPDAICKYCYIND